jgi:antitoxin VapB
MIIDTTNIQTNKDFQDIRIPSHLKIDDNKVYLKKVGNIIYLIPYHNPWHNMMESLNNFTEDFMEHREQPVPQTRESFDE